MSHPTNNFKVYQASAGAGKTYTIIKEYLSLCLKSKDSTSRFSQILAITFTNMAANEMKAKIVRQLNNIIQSDFNEAPKGMEADLIEELGIDRKALKANAELLFQKIIHDYSSFCVSTIDAFVQKLSRSFAKELGLPTQFNVSIDEDEVADAITERIVEQIGTSNPFLTKILEDFSEMKFDSEKSPKIASNIHDFTKKLFAEEAFQKDEQNHFEREEQYKETLDFINGKLHHFEALCKKFTNDFEDFIHTHNLVEDDFYYKAQGPCLSLLKNLKEGNFIALGNRQMQIIDGSLKWYSKNFAKKADFNSIDTDFQQLFVEFLKKYQKNIGNYLFYKSQLSKLSLYVLRSKIKSEMEAYIGEEQIVHISEFNKRINEIMGDFSVPFVYERIGEHFQHLFIDEFQDTSVLQWQNLLPLLDNTLANNHLSMVVGDGKQSIYRWRNGEVEQIVSLPQIKEKPDEAPVFDNYEQNLINNFNFKELKTNHRSFENIIDFNNDFFSFSAGYLSENSRKVYVEKNERFHKEVSIEQKHYLKDKGFVQVELFDPSECDDETMLGHVKEIIEDVLDKGFLKSDITILVRTNKIGSMIANYLNENNIAVISAESILLKSSDRVQLIVNTLDYLIHDNNAAVVAAVLYYWNVTHRHGFDGVVDGIFDHANRIAKGEISIEDGMGLETGALKSLLTKSYSLYDLCSAIIRLFGFNMVGDSFLNFLLDTVHKWQSTDETGIGSFLEYWEKKKDKLAVISGNDNAIRVMTIHKAKGLEFNVVICPFVNDDIDEKKASTIWITPEALGFESIPNIEKIQFTFNKDSALWSPQAKLLAEQENAKVRLDNMNINYVAFTRAVQRLHILSYKTKDEGKSPLNAFLEDHPNTYGDPESRKVESKEEEVKVNDIFTESASSEWFDKISIDPEPSMFWISKDDPMKPQEWGELVHQILSEAQHKDDIEDALNHHIGSGEIDYATAEKLKTWFNQMASHPLIGEAFSTEAKIKNECEILMADGEICRPDRYAELPDKILLLDYKTGKKDKEHQEQLKLYISVLNKMVNKRIDAFLVYLGDHLEVVPISEKTQQLSINFQYTAMKKLFSITLLVLLGLTVNAQQEAKMLRFPTIHGNDVVFTHGGDLYKVDIKGGIAHKITNDVDGYEMFARFSPDGKHLAFTGQYDGNTEVYVMPYPECGTPTRLTYTATLSRDDVSDRMGPNNMVMAWKDNENIVFRSRKQSWDDFVGQLFLANIEGGIAEQLPLPEGGWISYSPDGKKIAYNRVMREFRTWKYYKGGMADDVWIYDFKSKKIENITNNDAQDIFPMWVGEKVYFCSDRDRTMNLFVYDLKTKQTTKVTDYTYYDIKYPSLGDNDIVYENGGELFRYNLNDGKVYPIPVQIVDDGNSTRNKYVDCSKFINSSSIAPDGNRVAFGARGDVWTVPAKSGITRNLTQSDGVHDRDVAWSPDGKYIAYISDRTGEDEIYIQTQDGKEEAIQLTKNSDTYKSDPKWSPNSKYISWYDKMNRLNMVEVSSKKVTVVAENHTGEMDEYCWSADSRWIAYTMPSTFGVSRIHVYNVASGKDEVVTEALFNSGYPAFDKNGKYLYFTSQRDFRPTYSQTEWNHVYTDMTRIYMVTLQKDTPSPFLTENDEVQLEGDKKDGPKDGPKGPDGKGPKGKGSKGGKGGPDMPGFGPEKPGSKEAKEVKIDFEGIMHRVIALPVSAGNYFNLTGVDDGLYYVGAGRNGGGLGYFDVKTKKCTTIGGFGYELSADGSKMLLRERGGYKIINAPKGPMPGGGGPKEGPSMGDPGGPGGMPFDMGGGGKIEGGLDLSQMKKWVNLKEEWIQILNEAWRQERDFFYAPNMHGVDWPAMKEKYGRLVPYCSDRYDLTYLIGEMIGEINIGHAYVGEGDRLKPERIQLGLLGAKIHRDKSGYFQIDKILKGENWNEKTRSPLTEVGVNVEEGDYIIAIDGQSTKDMKDMYKALVGKANTPVLLTVNSKASEGGSRDVVVKPIADENGLYYYNMVQDNIEKVSKATDGQVGYIHIPDMGVEGLNEFAKYFYPQLDKKALIIDDRGNGGGNVSPMIIERLRRELSMYDMMRNCEPETKPTKMVLGPKVLLFNKYSASDGDLFPYQFKKHKIGTTIGTRSWGGVVGIRGSLPFIDGGTLTRPEFAPFDENGNWVIEGYGVDPDIVIDNDPGHEFDGIDDQLNKAIEVILEQMKDYPEIPDIPAFPDKSK